MNHNVRLSRRNFIRASGLSLAMAVAAPVSPLASVFASADLSLKIGILLPQSTRYPTLESEFLAGFQHYFAHAPQVTWKVAPISQSYHSVVEQGQLLDESGVDVLVGVVGSRLLPLLKDWLTAQQIHLVASNLGANISRYEETHPFIIPNTLNYWQANWALGEWAAETMGKRAVLATTSYDGGYDAFSAFRVAYENAGGEVLHLHIHESASPADFAQALRDHRPDFVYAAYSGAEAADFAASYARLGTAIPLVGSPIFGEFAEVYTSSFLPHYEGVANNPFAVLGYQAAIKAASGRLGRNSLFEQQAATPQFYLREKDAWKQALTPLHLPTAESRLILGQSGWVNAYLAI